MLLGEAMLLSKATRRHPTSGEDSREPSQPVAVQATPTLTPKDNNMLSVKGITGIKNEVAVASILTATSKLASEELSQSWATTWASSKSSSIWGDQVADSIWRRCDG